MLPDKMNWAHVREEIVWFLFVWVYRLVCLMALVGIGFTLNGLFSLFWPHWVSLSCMGIILVLLVLVFGIRGYERMEEGWIIVAIAFLLWTVSPAIREAHQNALHRQSQQKALHD